MDGELVVMLLSLLFVLGFAYNKHVSNMTPEERNANFKRFIRNHKKSLFILFLIICVAIAIPNFQRYYKNSSVVSLAEQISDEYLLTDTNVKLNYMGEYSGYPHYQLSIKSDQFENLSPSKKMAFEDRVLGIEVIGTLITTEINGNAVHFSEPPIGYSTYTAPNQSEHYQCSKCNYEYGLSLSAGTAGWIGCPECGDVPYDKWMKWYENALDRYGP